MNLTNILEQEKAVAQMIQQLKEEIAQQVRDKPLDDVEVISPNICIVKLSALKNNVWTPEYYIPAMQAKYIEQALESITTASAFVKKVQEMVDKNGVKIGCNFHPLNPTAIEILKKYL